MRTLSIRCFRLISGCANIGGTSNRLNAGRMQNLTRYGGGNLRDTGGTGFWHELYSVRGGFESVYVDVQQPIGFLRFANLLPAKGSLFSARDRLRRGGVAERPAPYTESEL